MDGSKDGDISTLHLQSLHRGRDDPEHALRTEALLRKVKIPLRTPKDSTEQQEPISLRKRAPNNKHPPYYLLYINQRADLTQIAKTRLRVTTEGDLRTLQHKEIEEFTRRLRADLTNMDNPMPDSQNLLCYDDLQALQDVWRAHRGEVGVEYLMTKMLGLPMRNQRSGIRRFADPHPIIPALHSAPTRPRISSTSKSRLSQNVLNRVLSNPNPSIDHTRSWLLDRDVQFKHRQLQRQQAVALNPEIADRERSELNRLASMAVGGTKWCPHGTVQPRQLIHRNWIQRRGGEIGTSSAGMDVWLDAWQELCECTGALIELEYNDTEDATGLLRHARMRTNVLSFIHDCIFSCRSVVLAELRWRRWEAHKYVQVAGDPCRHIRRLVLWSAASTAD